MVAADRGESFDRVTGEPLSWSSEATELSVYEWAAQWVAEQWAEWQPRTRTSALEALSRFVVLAVSSRADAPPPDVRSYLKRVLSPDVAADPSDERERWLGRLSMPLAELSRQSLAFVDAALGKSLDGSQLAPSTAGRYRKVARACIRRAVELDILAAFHGRHSRRVADIESRFANGLRSTSVSSPTLRR